jgi:Chlorophyll A-B binding protein
LYGSHSFENYTTDYNWDKFKPKDDAKYQDKVNSELLNGRLAMIAVGGIATQSIITGHGFPYV